MNKNNEKTAKTRIALISLSLAVMLTAMAVAVITFSAPAEESATLGAVPGDTFDDGVFDYEVLDAWDSSDPTTPGTVFVKSFTSVFLPIPASYMATVPASVTDPLEAGSAYDVVGIGPGAFANEIDLEGITLPTSVTWIDDNAFEGTGLIHAWPGSLDLSYVEYIGDEAFKDCTALEDVIFGSGLWSLGERAFENSGLQYVSLNGTMLTAIEDYAFYGCVSLSVVDLPSGVSIGEHAFDSCIVMTQALGVETVRSFGDYAFNNCVALDINYIVLGSAGTDAFLGCNIGVVAMPYGSPINLVSIGAATAGYTPVIIYFSGMSDIVLDVDAPWIDVMGFSPALAPGQTGSISVDINEIAPGVFGGHLGTYPLDTFNIALPSVPYPSYDVIYISLTTGYVVDVNINSALPSGWAMYRYTTDGGTTWTPLTGSTSLVIPNGSTVAFDALCTGGFDIIYFGDVAFNIMSGYWEVLVNADKTVNIGWSYTSYRIFFDGLNGSTEPTAKTSYTSNETLTDALIGSPSAIPAGYTFLGWTVGNGGSALPITGIAGDITLWATWNVSSYSITYVYTTSSLGNPIVGTPANSNPATYNAGSVITFAPLSVPAGYTFVEWQDSTNTAVSGITAGMTGAQTFTAVIDEIAYNVVYHGLPAGSTYPIMISHTIGLNATTRSASNTDFAASLPYGYQFNQWLWGTSVAADIPDDPFVGIPSGYTGDIHLWADADAQLCTIIINCGATPAGIIFEYLTDPAAGWQQVTPAAGVVTITVDYGSSVMIRCATPGYDWTFTIPAAWNALPAAPYSYSGGILSFTVDTDTLDAELNPSVPVYQVTLSGTFTAQNYSVTVRCTGEVPLKPVFEYTVSDDRGVTWSGWTAVEGNVINGIVLGQIVKVRSATPSYTFEWDMAQPGMSAYTEQDGELEFLFDATFLNTYNATIYGEYTYTSFSWAWFIVAVTMVAVLGFFALLGIRRH